MLVRGDKLYNVFLGKLDTVSFIEQKTVNSTTFYVVQLDRKVVWGQFAHVDVRDWFPTAKEAYQNYLQHLHKVRRQLVERQKETAEGLKSTEQKIRQIEQLIA